VLIKLSQINTGYYLLGVLFYVGKSLACPWHCAGNLASKHYSLITVPYLIFNMFDLCPSGFTSV
jgi:hypothetical protein